MAEHNIVVYIQMCQIKERLFPFESADKRKEEYTAARCAGLHYLSFTTQIFFKDADFSPLLAVLAAYASGEEELRAEFRRLCIRNIISKTLQRSHINPLVSEHCYKVLDTATDGKSEGVILLFEENDVLKHEIRYDLRNFRKGSGICVEKISIMTKLVRADTYAAKWMGGDDVQDDITMIAEHHRNVVTIDSACNQLMILLNYTGGKDSRVKTEVQGHVRPSRNP